MLTAVLRLRDALQNENSTVTLDVAALELASIEFPQLDLEASLFRLEHLAEQVRARAGPGVSGLDFIESLNGLLFDTLQYRGNNDNYYDPRNSCLNSVLSRRLGIPVSLSVVYMEIGRRLGRSFSGVGLPGHFIVAYQDAEARYWVDPFHRGRILSFEDCCALANETAGVDVRENPLALAAVSTRYILLRMLGNLKAIYLRGRALDKARQVLDLIIHARPDDAEEYRHRGLIHLQQLNHRAAKADLEMFLRLSGSAGERDQVEQQLILIERWKAAMN